MLFIFEGPDSVGKSTISGSFANQIAAPGRKVDYFTFPGREEGTLGHVVYRLHHAPHEFGVSKITPTSLQVLHIAAHVDAIQSRILPALDAGVVVVLDRFWWSTLVYGIVTGAPKAALEAMINVELQVWLDITPTVSFLIQREVPFKLRSDERLADWHRLNAEYQLLADQQRSSHRVVRILNESSPDDAVRAAVQVANEYLL